MNKQVHTKNNYKWVNSNSKIPYHKDQLFNLTVDLVLTFYLDHSKNVLIELNWSGLNKNITATSWSKYESLFEWLNANT